MSHPQPRMASYPFLFSEIMTKSRRNGCVPIVTDCAMRTPNDLIPCWSAVNNWNVGGHNASCPNLFQVSSGNTFTPDPPSTIVSIRTIPRIPISTTARCRPDERASNVGSSALAPLSFSLPCSTGNLADGAMFVSADQS